MKRLSTIALYAMLIALALVGGRMIAGLSGARGANASNFTAPSPMPSPTFRPAPTRAPTATPTPKPARSTPTPQPSATPVPPKPTVQAPTATSAPPAAEATAAPAASYVEYTVQHGDSLNRIAKRYGVTAEQIMAANRIPNPDSLKVGTVLQIPK